MKNKEITLSNDTKVLLEDVSTSSNEPMIHLVVTKSADVMTDILLKFYLEVQNNIDKILSFSLN